MPANDLTDAQADRLRAEMEQVLSLREVANVVCDVVVAAVVGSGADEEDSKKILHMIIIRLQELRDST